MKARRKVGPVSDRPAASGSAKGRSKTGPTPTREVTITNHHPRLRFSRTAVVKALALLDAQFELQAGELAYLSLPRSRQSALKSKIENQKSKIHPVPPGELSLVFLTDPALAKIHGDFMDDPSATDVITFEGDPATELAGEICVSVDTAARYVGLGEGRTRGQVERVAPQRALSGGGKASARGSSALHPGKRPALQEKFAAELTLYVVHGWLHLAGYDDLQPAKKRRMRAAEARALKLLRAAKAVPNFRMK